MTAKTKPDKTPLEQLKAARKLLSERPSYGAAADLQKLTRSYALRLA